MQSAWTDRDADAAIARYAQRRRPRPGAHGSTPRACSASDPRWCCMAAATPRSRRSWPISTARPSTCSASRAPAGTWARSSRAGLPAVRLAPLRKLRARDKLSDEDMVQLQRANLLDPMAPNPSVETLLHAFLPHKFVDHTHATAVLAPDRPARRRGACAARSMATASAIVPYIMPGFALAKAAAEVFDADPDGRRADPAQARHLHASATTRAKPMSA